MHIKFRNKFHIPCLSSIESRASSSVFNLLKCSKSTLLIRKTMLSFMSHSISFLNIEQSIKLSLCLISCSPCPIPCSPCFIPCSPCSIPCSPCSIPCSLCPIPCT